MSETLPSTATGEDEKKATSTTAAHDTRQMGGDFSATIDFNKQNVPEARTETMATAETTAQEHAPEQENPAVVVASLEKEQLTAAKQLESFDASAAKTGKPLENSEFLDRASLAEKAMSSELLSSQKKLALAEMSPEAATPAGQAEIARLKEERKRAIEVYKSKVDIQASETAMRAAKELMSDPYTELSQVAAHALAKSFTRQSQLRADLDTLEMLPEDIKAVITETVSETEVVPTGGPESVESVVDQLRQDGAEKTMPTEKVDDVLRVSLLNFGEVIARIAAQSSDPKEKALFEGMLENLKRLTELVAAKTEKDTKVGIREALGITSGQSGATGAALEKFTLGLAAEKKGKGGSFFKNLMGKIGQLSWVKKIKGMFAGAGKGLESLPGLTKLGFAGVKGRLEGLLAGQFGKLDLGKTLKTTITQTTTVETSKSGTMTTETSKIETTSEDNLEGVRTKMQALNARMDAYDIANPGKSDSSESQAMEAEYALLRTRFDELNKTSGVEEGAKPEIAQAAESADNGVVDIIKYPLDGLENNIPNQNIDQRINFVKELVGRRAVLKEHPESMAVVQRVLDTEIPDADRVLREMEAVTEGITNPEARAAAQAENVRRRAELELARQLLENQLANKTEEGGGFEAAAALNTEFENGFSASLGEAVAGGKLTAESLKAILETPRPGVNMTKFKEVQNKIMLKALTDKNTKMGMEARRALENALGDVIEAYKDVGEDRLYKVGGNYIGETKA